METDWHIAGFDEVERQLVKLRPYLPDGDSTVKEHNGNVCGSSRMYEKCFPDEHCAPSDGGDESLLSLVNVGGSSNSTPLCGSSVSSSWFEFTDTVVSVSIRHQYQFLGKGAHSTVYRGTITDHAHQNEVRTVAVKVTRLQFVCPGDIDHLIRILRLGKSICHSCFIRCFYIGLPQVKDGQREEIKLYEALELASGGTLDTLLKKEERLSENVVRRILVNILGVLKHLHDEVGVVHNDVKPLNILLVAGESKNDVRYKLSDIDAMCAINPSRFGDDVRITGDANMEGSERLCGTPLYMSPESCRGVYSLPANDIWSVGVMTYQLSTGRLPWGQLELQVPSMILHGFRRVGDSSFGPILDEFNPDYVSTYSDELKDFVRCCLTKEASDRPSASTLLRHPFISASVT
ncbi:putative protein kinase [Trypanosoma vivax]|nr:putative protein kinase [Trypanosoma vivax]